MQGRPIPNDFYGMELIGDDIMLVGVPLSAPSELKRRVIAAVKSYHAGNGSVDLTLKRYGQGWNYPEPDEEQLFLQRALKRINTRVDYIVKLLSNGKPRPDFPGLIAAEAALIRLKPSFRSASLLIWQGYPFEAASICRIILEQMSWVYSIYQLDNYDNIIRTKSPKTITKFKEVISYAGQFYGELSSQTHLDPEEHRHYIAADESGGLVIRFYLPDNAKEMLIYLMVLLKVYYKMVRIVSGAFVEERVEEHHDLDADYKTETELLEEDYRRLEKYLQDKVKGFLKDL